ncbi:MAG: AbrB/MazE/SpoVT family DNA-binding domain-containing protein [Firmicutes bacterium]|nr:AbrB/MazE/SpoVT family DNA-binding domain-containing protein [Bacillota bacterium]
MNTEIMRVSAKGQFTIPVSVRKKFNIREGDYLQIWIENDEIRVKKVEPIQPLSPEDPIWKLIGAGESGYSDVSTNHDRYLAAGENKRWKE